MTKGKIRIRRKHPRGGGNYMQAIQRLQPLPDKVHDVIVLHDPWCRIYAGGKCNCQPDLECRGAAGEIVTVRQPLTKEPA